MFGIFAALADFERGPCSAANLGIKQGELREQGEKVLAS